MDKIFVCPMPDIWNNVYQDLLTAWKAEGQYGITEPLCFTGKNYADFWFGVILRKIHHGEDGIGWQEVRKDVLSQYFGDR